MSLTEKINRQDLRYYSILPKIKKLVSKCFSSIYFTSFICTENILRENFIENNEIKYGKITKHPIMEK